MGNAYSLVYGVITCSDATAGPRAAGEPQIVLPLVETSGESVAHPVSERYYYYKSNLKHGGATQAHAAASGSLGPPGVGTVGPCTSSTSSPHQRRRRPQAAPGPTGTAGPTPQPPLHPTPPRPTKATSADTKAAPAVPTSNPNLKPQAEVFSPAPSATKVAPVADPTGTGQPALAPEDGSANPVRVLGQVKAFLTAAILKMKHSQAGKMKNENDKAATFALIDKTLKDAGDRLKELYCHAPDGWTARLKKVMVAFGTWVKDLFKSMPVAPFFKTLVKVGKWVVRFYAMLLEKLAGLDSAWSCCLATVECLASH